MKDNDIIDLFLARDENAFTQTAEKYGVRLRGIAYGILSDFESAKECENDTYLEAWNRIPPHEPRDYFFAFLGKITRAVALNRFRELHRQKRDVVTCELTEELRECLTPEEEVERKLTSEEITRSIEAFLDSRTQEQQNIFVRRYWYCDSIRDISKQYHMSQSKVKSLLFRMRKDLKQALKEGGYPL